jgi:ABC-type multidrug transport system fused ATPase/permease subunit
MNEGSTINVFDLLKRLWKHVSSRRRFQLRALFLLMMFVSFIEIISIGSIMPFLGVLTAPNLVFNHSLVQPFVMLFGLTEPKQLLAPLFILFIFATTISGGMRFLLSWFQTRLSFSMGADFSNLIFKRTLYQPYEVHLSRNSSEVIAAVTSLSNGIVHNAINPILSITSSIIIVIAIITALFLVQPEVTILSIIFFGGIYALVIFITRQRMLENSRQITEQSIRVLKILQEALGGIRDLILDNTQKVYCNIFENTDKKLRIAQSNITIISISPRFIIETLGMVAISTLAYIITIDSDSSAFTIPIIGTLALAAQRMLPMLQLAYSSWSSIRGGQKGLSEALLFLEQSVPKNIENPHFEPILFSNELALSNISFRYAIDQPWILQELNLKIQKNSRIGLIGTTGSGKSTFLDIVMGLLSPTDGELMVDGKVIKCKERSSWQAHIAHVPQSIFLADISIAENIAFGIQKSEIDFQKARRCAAAAQIATTIEAWPLQYDTVVGERGIRLSGGQKQRIGIARALYKEADVIILDEATSALDAETESAVMDSINSLSRDLTIIIVAHRLTTLRNCTRVIELKNGAVNRIGSYQEIIGINHL